MEASKVDRLLIYKELIKQLKMYTKEQIESGIMIYCLSAIGGNYNEYLSEESECIAKIIEGKGLPTDLETIVEFFEALLETSNRNENGIVFTPKYIADYIVANTIGNMETYDNTAIIDPGCGCGIFLVSAAEALQAKFGVGINQIIENNIFGIDIDPDNARRCCLVLRLLSAQYDGDYLNLKTNIKCKDSLDCSWNDLFAVQSFDYILGNPPYVNPHDMNKETVAFLKNNFVTTKTGVFNIFYAFIEQAVKFLGNDGKLGFILPNNFLSIKSAKNLRIFLQQEKYIEAIIDFGDNMVFKPVRTYSCIVFISKRRADTFKYCVLENAETIEAALISASFSEMPMSNLDQNGWKLVDKHTYKNIKLIETQMVPIREFIRTGIATLRDEVYLVEKDDLGYYKTFAEEKMYIETDLVKPIYKIPDLKRYDTIEEAQRFIIFPYVEAATGYALIEESLFQSKYPQTYLCLEKQRDELDARDKGKGVVPGWYAYGRTQGLNKYGKKLLFPTFSNRPKFMYVSDEDALFCNGYAVFENEKYDLEILQKILNSQLMDYYVSNTSYSIEGGYYCYQKRYVERFSIPWLVEEEIDNIRSEYGKGLDDYLWKLYQLN